MPDGSSRIREEMGAGDAAAPETQTDAPLGSLLRRIGRAVSRAFEDGSRRCLARSEVQAMMMVSRDIGPYVRKVSDRLHECRERRSQRRALMALDDRMMRDIGIGRADAEQEYRKPFWR